MISHTADAHWPTMYDYEVAMRDMDKNLLDPQLSRGKLFNTISGFPLSFGVPDANTCLYRIDNWMIRCFCRVENREPSDSITERYQKLSQFYQNNHMHVSALVPLYYLQEGIRVQFLDQELSNASAGFKKESVLPIVKMHFVQGLSLGTFIAINFRNSQIMEQLSRSWLRMIYEMKAVRMAHGDLDLTNVRVENAQFNRELVLKLIDYDNVWIPGFDYLLPEYGHEAFQHPGYYGKSSLYNQDIDRFSALVIYISLRAIALNSDLYEQFGADENHLLFSSSDYKAERTHLPGHISQLREMNFPELVPYMDELCSSLHENRLPISLDSLDPFIINAPVMNTRYQPIPIDKNNLSETPKALLKSDEKSPLKLVFCYAHEDEDLLDKLKKQIMPLKREGLIDVWYDRDIDPGTEWEWAIDEHLNTAHIILLLISPDFMYSEYCYGTEMKRALERHQQRKARVIPVILHPIDWQATPIRILKPLPKDGIPVVDPRWHTVNHALYDVESGVKDIIKKHWNL